MAITVEHNVPAAVVAGPAFMGGAEKRRQADQAVALQVAEMAQKAQMQQNSIAAQQASQANQLQAGFLENWQRHAQQMQVLGAQQKFTGQQNEAENAARLKAILAQGQAQLAGQNNSAANQLSNWQAMRAQEAQQNQTVVQQRSQVAQAIGTPSPEMQAYEQDIQQNFAGYDYSREQQKRIDAAKTELDALKTHALNGKIPDLAAAQALRSQIEARIFAEKPTQRRMEDQEWFDKNKIDMGNGAFGLRKPDGSIQPLLPPKSTPELEQAKLEAALQEQREKQYGSAYDATYRDMITSGKSRDEAKAAALNAMQDKMEAFEARQRALQGSAPQAQQQGQAQPRQTTMPEVAQYDADGQPVNPAAAQASVPPYLQAGMQFTQEQQAQQATAPTEKPARRAGMGDVKNAEANPVEKMPLPNELPVPKSEQDYASLPRGAFYIHPSDGSMRRKP